MNIIDFILHHSIFNESLAKAIEHKNKTEVNRIIQSQYADELSDGFVTGSLDFDIDQLNMKYVIQLASDDFNWAL